MLNAKFYYISGDRTDDLWHALVNKVWYYCWDDGRQDMEFGIGKIDPVGDVQEKVPDRIIKALITGLTN